MDIIIDNLNKINNICKKNNINKSSISNNNLNLVLFSKRKEVIRDLTSVVNDLTQLLEQINNLNQTDINFLQNKIDTNITNDIKVDNTIDDIFITKNISLPAKKVNQFDNVKRDGTLYFVIPANHFAIYIANNLYHANIGVIGDKINTKMRECKFGNSSPDCWKYRNCSYYHDPIKFSASNDIRNYNQNDFMYNKKWGMQIGSLENLEQDLMNFPQENISKFNDMVMHLIICSLLINKQ